MKTLFVATIATQLCIALCCNALAGQPAENQPSVSPVFDAPPEPATQEAAPPAGASDIQINPQKWQQMRGEILRIRQQLGFNPLAELNLGDDEASDDLFARTLDGVAGAKSETKPPAPQQLPPAIPPLGTPPVISGLPLLPPPPSIPTTPPAAELSYRDTLLAAARKLDRKADFLEDTDRVPEARKLRRLAGRIRNEALGKER